MSERPLPGTGYAALGQYYDLIFPDAVRGQLAAALRALLPGVRRVVEIGPGTGLFTETMVRLLPPDGELFAIEPSPVMRAALATRLAALPAAAERVTILATDALTADPPETADAVVLLNVVMHFSPAERAQLWRGWAAALNPGGLVVVESQNPQTAVAVPPTVTPGRRLGRHRYETVSHADVLDSDRISWTMTYRTLADEHPIREDTVVFDCYVISDQQLDAELADAGLTRVPHHPDGVLAWSVPSAVTG